MTRHLLKRVILKGLMAATLGVEGCAIRYAGVYATAPPPPSVWKRMGPRPDPGLFGFKAIGAGAATLMFGFPADGTTFLLGGTDGKWCIGCDITPATTGETDAGVNVSR